MKSGSKYYKLSTFKMTYDKKGHCLSVKAKSLNYEDVWEDDPYLAQSFTYDKKGNLTKFVDPAAVYTFSNTYKKKKLRKVKITDVEEGKVISVRAYNTKKLLTSRTYNTKVYKYKYSKKKGTVKKCVVTCKGNSKYKRTLYYNKKGKLIKDVLKKITVTGSIPNEDIYRNKKITGIVKFSYNKNKSVKSISTSEKTMYDRYDHETGKTDKGHVTVDQDKTTYKSKKDETFYKFKRLL